MKKISAVLLFTSLLVVFVKVHTKAQDFKILTKSANIIDNKLVVTYDLTKSSQNENFMVWLEIKNSLGEKLKIKSVTGDVGKNISAGKNKQITWDFIIDNIVIDDNIGIEVKTEIMSKKHEELKLGKALLLSAVVPGLGLTKVTQRKSYLVMSAITYGSAIMSYISYNNAYNNYNEYLSGNELSSDSEQYSNSLSQKSMSNTFMYVAIASWTANMVWTYIVVSKNNKSENSFSSKQKMKLTTGYNAFYKTPVFGLKYNF